MVHRRRSGLCPLRRASKAFATRVKIRAGGKSRPIGENRAAQRADSEPETPPPWRRPISRQFGPSIVRRRRLLASSFDRATSSTTLLLNRLRSGSKSEARLSRRVPSEPSANLTGIIANLAAELPAKQLQLLYELIANAGVWRCRDTFQVRSCPMGPADQKSGLSASGIGWRF